MYVNQDIFWTQYTDFDNKNGSCDGDSFIWKRKYIRDGKRHLWHHKYSLPCTKIHGFVACRFTSKVLGIGAAESSWGEVKTIKSGKISATNSDVSEKQSIVYTPAYIESTIIEQYHYDKKKKTIVQVISGMKRMMLLINNSENGARKNYFLIYQNL